ncbi:MAG TPA: hypothetical protein VIM63_10210, partial [Rhodoferax sp.]
VLAWTRNQPARGSPEARSQGRCVRRLKNEIRFAFAPLSAFDSPLLPDAVDTAGKLPRLAWVVNDLYKKSSYSPYV